MFEKVNPAHPDKIADRIAGAIVDLAYKKADNPHIAVEVLIGHRLCQIIIETDVNINKKEMKKIVHRICGKVKVKALITKQDVNLSNNQNEKIKCGDNGIFKGTPTTAEQKELSQIAREIYSKFSSDGKYIIDNDKLIICQSNAKTKKLKNLYPNATINPLGFWTGGIDVDAGATNRKLGSDMGDAVTGGGLHGKDLSKADITLNIYAYLKAQKLNKPVLISCAIGDEKINGIEYSEIVEIAKEYIKNQGGFENFAKWGFI